MRSPKDGFREAKRKVLAALAAGTYLHEARNQVDVKNKFAMGEISASEIAQIIKKSTGNDHSRSPHHSDQTIIVHVIAKQGWYIKFYFLDPNAVFISVHR